jgi:hypothetical protein
MGTLAGLRGIPQGATMSDWRRLLNPVARCMAIPEGAEFPLAPMPRGMPANRAAIFARIAAHEQVLPNFTALVQLVDGEYVVGQVSAADGGMFHYLPRNITDGLVGSIINRDAIVARLV